MAPRRAARATLRWLGTGLFLAHGRELELYLSRRLRCAHTAADLTQETFLRLAQQPSEAGEVNAGVYLYRTARNLAIDRFRQEECRQTRPVDVT